MTALAINAFYRTGSSLLYDVLNKSSVFNGFYEPLHPKIMDKYAIPDASLEKKTLGHTFSGDYFSIYQTLSEECLGYHKLFRSSVKPHQYPILNKSAKNYGMKKYLSSLVTQCENNISLLQFNRVLFCLPWLRVNFPDWNILHLSRNPRNIFCSLSNLASQESIDLFANQLSDYWGVKSHLKYLCKVCDVQYDNCISSMDYYQQLYLLIYISDILGKIFCDYYISYENIVNGKIDVIKRMLGDLKINDREQIIIFNELENKLKLISSENNWSDIEYNFLDKEMELLSIVGKENIVKLINYFTGNKKYIEHSDGFVQLSNSIADIGNEYTINHTKIFKHIRIGHVINPYLVDGAIDKVQTRTIDSIGIALDMVSTASNVDIISAIHAKDFCSIPVLTSRHIYLDKMIGDLLVTKRSDLPLLGEMLEKIRLFKDEYDYLILTNMDICLQPYFYIEIQRLISSGLDAFVVNRRTIPQGNIDDKDLSKSYREYGESHPGHDCFVFKSDILDSIYMENHCLGAGFVYRPLLLNLILFSDNFKEFTNKRLTFHYGNDETWRDKDSESLIEFNRNELISCYRYLKNEHRALFLEKSALLNKYFNFAFLKDNVDEEV